jgi:Complex1_LYR-like
MAAAQRSFALRLYRTLLKTHRAKLPPDMRALGDSYVQAEFRAHKHAKKEFLDPFFQGWLSYLQNLTESQPATIGRDMPQDLQQALSEEQSATLDRLRDESYKLGFTSPDGQVEPDNKQN